MIVVDRVAVWAEGRGWIYWRHRPRNAGVGPSVLGQVESLLSPSYRHVVEETRAKQVLRIDQTAGEDNGQIVIVARGDRKDRR
ncbi:hypothetical protein [Nocardia seriolae]|uniref:hypothetical protein n=1 Tax=Nocardia seriolae TaxID=37332 RepID=UPI0011604EBC|nr:hypothetical protein [Nocardia seriolae]QOW34451.1 hypothetical protein IMZ23_05085 [Nocardia seriolae]QUN18093.1 hypothetical protein KEC46_00950 [Nocardia seriolae]WNJ61653.1 hypothetical protein RMO66_13755 [Nocardia seriolae]